MKKTNDITMQIQVENYIRGRRSKPSIKHREFINYRYLLEQQFPTKRKNPYAFKSAQMEYQFQQLRRRFSLTRQEFETYYKNVRRANKKYYNIQRNQDALFQPYYSTSVDMITSREIFTQYQKSLKFTLSKEFKSFQNRLFRERLYDNLRFAYGEDAENIIVIFDTYTDAQLYQFFKENQDIDFTLYDSDQFSVATGLLTVVSSAAEFVEKRIK